MADSFPFNREKYVLIAKIGKAHGIKGELKMHPFSGQLQSITQHSRFFLVSQQSGSPASFDVERSRPANKEVIVQLKGITSRNDAERLTGYGVLVEKDELPLAAKDEFYLHELEGLEVTTVEGDFIGKIISFFHNGVQDILIVEGGNKEFMIPLIPGMITKRDATGIVIAPPPGLLEINASNS